MARTLGVSEGHVIEWAEREAEQAARVAPKPPYPKWI